MSRCAMWVPGYSVIGQDPKVNAATTRVGWSATAEFGTTEASLPPQYFHFPIPTPTLLENKRATLVRVMLLFKSNVEFGPGIDRVDVWDGGRPLVRIARQVKGDYSDRIADGENIWDVNHDGVDWGVGVSVLVSGNAGGPFEFYGAGADFDYDL